MKIARSSRLKALTPGLILALLPFAVGISSARSQELPKTTVQEATLNGTATSVVATTLGAKPAGKPVSGPTGTFTAFALSKNTIPQLMAAGPDGAIYYAQAGSNKIGQIAVPSAADSGKITVRDFPIPTAESFPEGVTVAPDGTVWFTEQNAHNIGKLNPEKGEITEYRTPTPNSGPVGITVGPDNRIWFTEAFANKIGVLDPNNPEKMEEFAIPTPVSTPLYIIPGPDGGLWFAGVRSHKIGRIDPTSHVFAEYALPTPKAGPTSLLVGPDTAIWVSEFGVDKIARFDVKAKKFTDEVLINSRKNGPRSGPGMLVNGPDGNIWFTEMFGNQIGVLNPTTKQVIEFSAPEMHTNISDVPKTGDTAEQAKFDANVNLGGGQTLAPTSGPGGLAFSQDGTLWYTAIYANSVARLKLR